MKTSPKTPTKLPRRMIFGGRRMVVRMLCPDDRDRLMAFFNSHTEETVRSRYGYTFHHLSVERAAALVGIDQSRDAALGIFTGAGSSASLLAIGRACLLPDAATAEFAFVVHEDWRRLGMATALFQLLNQLMGERGVKRVVAQVQSDNRGMMRVFQTAGAELAAGTGSDTLTVRLRIGN